MLYFGCGARWFAAAGGFDGVGVVVCELEGCRALFGDVEEGRDRVADAEQKSDDSSA